MFYLGIDLGKRQDHTAIAIAERMDSRLELRYAERVPLGTSYPHVVERVRYMVAHQNSRGRCVIAVDATGGLRGERGQHYGRGERDAVREHVACAEEGSDGTGAGPAREGRV